MALSKINRSLLAASSLLFLPHFALAQIVITEIMYDLPAGSDSGREWIEVYNSGSSAVDLTKLRLFENDTNHKIAATGVSIVQPSAYAVIADNPAKFKTDWPQYSGALFDSTFDLGNAGDSIEMRDASSTVLDTATFTSALGASGDGNSLNRLPGTVVFTPHTPSPGAAMSADVIAPKVKLAPLPKVVAPKKSSKSVTTVSPSKTPTANSADIPTVGDSAQVAAAATTITPTWEWWLAAGLLILASAGAVVFARRSAKDDWDIVEDTSE